MRKPYYHWRFFVYTHIKASNGVVFYVGKGGHSKRAKKRDYERAYEPRPSNKHWDRIVKKHGLCVEIVASCRSDAEAQRLEKELIKHYGRLDLGAGTLINLTDGGDGHSGIILSEEARRKRSENAKKPRSEKWIAAIRKARKNGGNGGVVKKGDKLPEAWRKAIGKGISGERNGHYGVGNPKPVKNIKTGTIYPSIKAAAEGEGLSYARVYSNLEKMPKYNNTDLRFV
jgi:hypothetical protein